MASVRALTSTLRLARGPLCQRSAASRQPVQTRLGKQAERCYANGPTPSPAPKGNSNILMAGVIATLLAGGAGFYFKDSFGAAGTPITAGSASELGQRRGTFAAKKEDYQQVYDAIAKRLVEEDDYDDGSYGPVLLRLGWHASGTYDAATGTGGSNGATMRFAPEGDHGANSGLAAARAFLEPIKQQFPWITYSDLWTLAAVTAIQEMQGPAIPWRSGRQDRDVSYCTPDGRLPDASKKEDHLRAIFHRMGFNDAEIVALSGAHALGRCHTDRSGYDGPWTFSPTTLTNDYYKLLLDEKWSYKKWDGPLQFEDIKSKSLMMLPTDMALIKDKTFRKHVDRYARDNDVFFKEFSEVICKLLELGVPFKSSEDSRMTFKSSA